MKISNPIIATARRITYHFTAGENITAGQVVELSSVADNTVLVATLANRTRVAGVALNNALITELVEVCIYGVCEITAAEDITSGDTLSPTGAAGQVKKIDAKNSSADPAHTHVFTGNALAGHEHTQGAVAATGATQNVADASQTLNSRYAAPTSGGSPTEIFDALTNVAYLSSPTANHTHTNPNTQNVSAGTPAGTNAAKAEHTHAIYTAQIVGKALESVTAGNTLLCLVCLA